MRREKNWSSDAAGWQKMRHTKKKVLFFLVSRTKLSKLTTAYISWKREEWKQKKNVINIHTHPHTRRDIEIIEDENETWNHVEFEAKSEFSIFLCHFLPWHLVCTEL